MVFLIQQTMLYAIPLMIVALAGIFAAQVVGLDKYTKVLKKCMIPSLMIIAWGIAFILLANSLAPYIVIK